MEPTPTPELGLLPLDRAATLVAGLGFELVHDERLEEATALSGSHLVVALREDPTLTHFGPERMTWYVTSAGKGAGRGVAALERAAGADGGGLGPVHVIDRLEVENAFLTFGGVLRAAQPDPGTTIVVLDSPAPILRRSGHSQGVDPVAPQVAAFFARLLVPIDFTPGAEARIASLSPMALYAAFVADLGARYEAARPLRETNPQLSEWLTHEAHRLETTRPAEWEAGQQLLLDLELTKTA